MKTPAGSLLVICAMTTGLVLIPAGRLKAQNFTAWPVTRVAAGGGHSLFTRADGTVFVMGDNTYGQLGLGPAVPNMNVPTALTNGVGLIAAGGDHSLMTRGRQLWAMGANWSGQLGDGTTNNRFLPELVVTLPGSFANSESFTELAAGDSHSLYGFANRLSPSGGFSVMGDNTFGELGDGTNNNHLTPEEIESWNLTQPPVTACAGGWFHSLFVKSDGSLWAMGNDDSGQLGDGNDLQTNLPEKIESSGVTAVAAGSFSSYFVQNGALLGMGQSPGSRYPTFVGTLQDSSSAITVSSKAYFALFLLSDGTLWSMGEGSFGQLGIGFDINITNAPQFVTSNVVAIAAGYTHSLFIKSDGSLWGMGYNGDGELGTGDYNNRAAPVEIIAPPPQPVILSYSANMVLAWPTNGGFALQSTTNLASPAWAAVSPKPIVVGNQFVAVFETASAPQRFFRLALSP